MKINSTLKKENEIIQMMINENNVSLFDFYLT